MTLKELLEQVKNEHLQKGELENLRDEMAHLFSLYQIETASIKKRKALYWVTEKNVSINGKFLTNAEIDHRWEVTTDGQREIDLKYECLALKEELSSIKHRLYNIY